MKGVKGFQKGENHPMYGKHHTEESNIRRSNKLKGRPSPMKGRTSPMKGKHHSVESKKKLSDAHKGENNGMYGKHHTKESRKKTSEALKGENNGMYGKFGEEHHFYGKHHTEESKEKLRQIKGGKHWHWKGGKVKINCKLCGKEKYIVPSKIKQNGNNFCSGSCQSIWTVSHQKTKGTDIELLMKGELIKRNIEFEPQKSLLNITVVDFFIEPNIVIYCDGDYWHSLEKTKERDERQNLILSSNGYKVFRFIGKEIKKSVEKCVDKVINGQ